MGQLGQFIINHWGLVLAFVSILVLIFINEQLAQRKRAKEISPMDAVDCINHNDGVVIDLRDAETFKNGHIINSIRATPDDFKHERMDKYKNIPIILVCQRGVQAGLVASQLKTEGFKQPLVLSGGMSAWQAADLPIVKDK